MEKDFMVLKMGNQKNVEYFIRYEIMMITNIVNFNYSFSSSIYGIVKSLVYFCTGV